LPAGQAANAPRCRVEEVLLLLMFLAASNKRGRRHWGWMTFSFFENAHLRDG
jgi:hypothetical protein